MFRLLSGHMPLALRLISLIDYQQSFLTTSLHMSYCSLQGLIMETFVCLEVAFSRIFGITPLINLLQEVLHVALLVITLNIRDISDLICLQGEFTSPVMLNLTRLHSSLWILSLLPLQLIYFSQLTVMPIRCLSLNPIRPLLLWIHCRNLLLHATFAPTLHLCQVAPPDTSNVVLPPSATQTGPPSPSIPAASTNASTSGHPMVTLSKVGTCQSRHISNLSHVSSSALHQALFASKEPKGFKTAAKDPKWFAAMCDEIKALKLNVTWDLVPSPTRSNIVGSKWVFSTKFHADGTIDKYKARLVAQGFTQVPGLDYSATFSPVVKASTL